MDVQVSTVSVDAIIQDLVKQLGGERQNAGIEIVLRFPPAIKPIQTDAQKLKQVLMNLLENALKFTERGSVTVEVAVNPIDARPVRIDVIDTGIGMPPDQLNEIFEPFRQLERETERQFGGSGLGLSICRSLCNLMGHEIEVRSEPGRGSKFSIILGADARRLPLTA